jgi:polyphosphate kinase
MTTTSGRGVGTAEPAPATSEPDRTDHSDGAPEEGAARQQAAGQPPTGPQRYINRQLSWLDYSARVLAQADDHSQPLLERAKFVAIFASLVDEFFQVRVGALVEQIHAGLHRVSPDGMTIEEQLRAVRERVAGLVETEMRIWNELNPELDAAGIRYSDYSALDHDDRAHLDDVFNETIFPVLTPLAVDPAHPVPYNSNLSLNLAVTVGEPDSETVRIARIKVPPLLPRFIVLPDGERFVPLEQVVAAHLERLFPGMRILDHHPFRVTRNADYQLDEDESDNLLQAVEEVLKRRRRAPRVVRLEIAKDMAQPVLDLLLRELELEVAGVVTVDGPLDLTGLFALQRLDRPELKAEPWTPVVPARLVAIGRATEGGPGPTIFDVLRRQDVLVHLPYESFEASVEALVETAAADPDTLAIKQTLYRTDGASPIVKALIQASERGKQVVALVELTARFDEAANIEWARQLEQAGVHVVYGMVGLKTHAKTCLVVRREGGVIRRYCHVGTGNYNSVTAKTYEDLGLLTSDPEIGEDLTDLFNYLTGYSRQREYRQLLVAPRTLRSGLLKLIRRETGRGAQGKIVLKLNNVIDPEICDALYDASAAGTSVDLIARSVCGVRPQVPGLSENIRVRSLTGRFLQHSRIYRFGPDGSADWYIGSADLMGRNLDGRVEAIAPVHEPSLQERLQEIIDIELADDTLAWELGPTGEWTKVPTREGINAQRRMQELAATRSGAA